MGNCAVLLLIIHITMAWTTHKEQVYDPSLYLIPSPPLTDPGAWSYILRPAGDRKSGQGVSSKIEHEDHFTTGYKANSYKSPPSFIKNYDVMRLVGVVYGGLGGNDGFVKHGGYGAGSFGIIGNNGRNVYKSGSNSGWRSGWGNGKWGHYGSG